MTAISRSDANRPNRPLDGRLAPTTDPCPHRPRILCVDMQNLFAEDTPWRTPWMARVRPVVAELARYRLTRRSSPASSRHTAQTRRPAPGSAISNAGVSSPGNTRSPSPRAGTRAAGAGPASRRLRQAGLLTLPRWPAGALSPRRGIDTLVISGTETDVCVLAAVLDAVDHGYRVVIAVDALCSSSDETHDALMTLYHARFGQQIEVADTETILSQWANPVSLLR